MPHFNVVRWLSRTVCVRPLCLEQKKAQTKQYNKLQRKLRKLQHMM